MAKLEAHAQSQGCTQATVYTFDFQAKPFYEKLGYHVVYVFNDYPEKGHQKFLMVKSLS